MKCLAPHPTRELRCFLEEGHDGPHSSSFYNGGGSWGVPPEPRENCNAYGCVLEQGHDGPHRDSLGPFVDWRHERPPSAASEFLRAFTAAPESLHERVQELRAWWEQQLASDLEATLPKVEQYGAHDLEVMGRAFEALLPPLEGATPEDSLRRGMEAALWFYALGKIARVLSSLQNGHSSDDHWFDLSVYATMARRVREHGRWP